MKYYKILLSCFTLSLILTLQKVFNPDSIDLDYFLIGLVSSNALVIYFFVVKQKTLFFTLFMVLFALGDFVEFLNYLLPPVHAYYYTIKFSLLVLAYMALIIEVWKNMSLSVVLRKFKYHLLVLLLLTIYAVASLQIVIGDYWDYSMLEMFYNTTVLILLISSIIAYFYHDLKKYFLFFVGVLFLTTQEIIAIGYLFVSEKDWLMVMWVVSTAIGFSFLISQARIRYLPKEYKY